jgi:hypothetical protein
VLEAPITKVSGGGEEVEKKAGGALSQLLLEISQRVSYPCASKAGSKAQVSAVEKLSVVQHHHPQGNAAAGVARKGTKRPGKYPTPKRKAGEHSATGMGHESSPEKSATGKCRKASSLASSASNSSSSSGSSMVGSRNLSVLGYKHMSFIFSFHITCFIPVLLSIYIAGLQLFLRG